MIHSVSPPCVRTAFAWTIVVVVALATAPAQSSQSPSQSPAAGTARVLGTVIDSTTGQPIPGAFVRMTSRGLVIGQPTVVADAQGRFVFRDLPGGGFELTATARGYLAGDGHIESGMPAPSQAIELTDAEQLTDVVIRLAKPARLSGTIVDDAGEPVEDAQVGILRAEYVAGYRRLRIAGGGLSNDRGDYRSGPLVPGSYVVVALMQRTTVPVATRELIERLAGAPAKEQEDLSRAISGSGAFDLSSNGFRVGNFILQPGMGGASVGPAPGPDGKLLAAPTLFYPGVPSAAQASAVALEAGEERRGVNLQVRLVPSVRVSGRVTGPDGPLANLAVRLVPEGSEALVSEYPYEQSMTLTSSGGAFTFLAVPGGSYVAKAYWLPPAQRPGPPGAPPPPTDGPTLSGSLPVAVGESDVTDLVLTLRRGPSIHGRIVFDGSRPAPSGPLVTRGAIRFDLADGRAPASPPRPPLRASIEPDGQFHSIGLPAGRYLLRVENYPGWSLESAMLNGRDVSEDAIDVEGGADDVTGVVITLTDARTVVNGTVRTSTGAPAPDATVLLFSPDSTYWKDRSATPRRQMRATTSRTGAFTFLSLPAGEYLVLAISGEPPENWRMPAFMNEASRTATRVTVERRTTRAVNLTVSATPRGGGQ